MAKLSDEQKEAMQLGREQARAIREYLDALKWDGTRPGLPGDVEGVESLLDDYRERVEAEDDYLARVELIQKTLDLEEYLDELRAQPDLESAERGFVEHVEDYSERKGITYKAWRKLGVPASVLHEGGLSR